MPEIVKVAVLTPKGGAGKSTISLALAAAAVEAGRRVLLVDADPDGTATAWADARKRMGMPMPEGLTVAAHAAPDLHKRLPDAIQKSGADYVVIDGAPRTDEALTRSIVAAASHVLVPSQPSLPDLLRARSVVAVLREAEAKGVKRKAAFVLSRVKAGTRIAREFAEVLGKETLPLLDAGTRDLVAYADAVSAAQTILEYEPKGSAADEARAIYQAVRRL